MTREKRKCAEDHRLILTGNDQVGRYRLHEAGTLASKKPQWSPGEKKHFEVFHLRDVSHPVASVPANLPTPLTASRAANDIYMQGFFTSTMSRTPFTERRPLCGGGSHTSEACLVAKNKLIHTKPALVPATHLHIHSSPER